MVSGNRKQFFFSFLELAISSGKACLLCCHFVNLSAMAHLKRILQNDVKSYLTCLRHISGMGPIMLNITLLMAILTVCRHVLWCAVVHVMLLPTSGAYARFFNKGFHLYTSAHFIKSQNGSNYCEMKLSFLEACTLRFLAESSSNFKSTSGWNWKRMLNRLQCS